MDSNLIAAIVSLLVAIGALMIAFGAMVIACIAFKISKDSNTIGYRLMSFHLLHDLGDLSYNDKELIKKLLEGDDFFEEKDEELKDRIMSI